MKQKKISRSIGAAFIIFCCSAVSAKTPISNKTDVYNMFEYSPSDYHYMDDQEFEKQIKLAEKESKKRTPQSVTSDLKSIGVYFSADYLNLQSKLIGGSLYSVDDKGDLKANTEVKGVATVADLEALVDNANNPKIYDELKPDAQFIAAALAATAPTRSLAYRARPLFNRSNLIHAVAITSLRGINTGINVFAPTMQWKAGFNYFTFPVGKTYYKLSPEKLTSKDLSPKDRQNTFIENEAEAWAYVNYEVLPALDLYINRISALITSLGEQSFFIDARLAKSTGSSFAEAQDRFFKIGRSELNLILSNLLYNRSSLKSTLAYRWTGLFDIIEKMAQVYGFNTLFNPAFATAEKRNLAIMKGNKNFLTFRESNGASFMEASYNDLRESIRIGHMAWTSASKANDNFSPGVINPILDPRVINPYQRVINRSFNNLYSATGLLTANNSNDKIVSATNENSSVQFKLYDFYHGPSIPRDLKKFFPTNYQGGEDEFTAKNTSDTELANLINEAHKNSNIKFNVRNYLKGAPNQWDIDEYKKYFPEVKDSQGVINAAQVLSEAWGGWIIGLPLNAVVL